MSEIVKRHVLFFTCVCSSTRNRVF